MARAGRKPVELPSVLWRDLRCGGCGRKVGSTSRSQAVPVRCPDPFCAITPAVTTNEERDSFITHLVIAEQRSPETLGELYGMTRQGIARIVSSRV